MISHFLRGNSSIPNCTPIDIGIMCLQCKSIQYGDYVSLIPRRSNFAWFFTFLWESVSS